MIIYLHQLKEGLSHVVHITEVVLPSGERHKHLRSIELILDAALQDRHERQSLFIALGGGVVGDMTGFAAACFLRGADFLQVPTTLLAQVDSSVGGQTGVSHAMGKNMIGAFYQPRCVLVDTDTLSTLPDREYASGMAEVVKYGLIRDADFFEWQERNVDALMARDGDVVRAAAWPFQSTPGVRPVETADTMLVETYDANQLINEYNNPALHVSFAVTLFPLSRGGAVTLCGSEAAMASMVP